MVGLSYYICTFLVTRPFHGYQNFWPSDLDLGVWPTFKRKLTLAIASLPEESGLSYFTCAFLVARTSMLYHDFWHSDLDLPGCPTLKKIVLDYDFWIRGVTYCCYLHMVAAGELCCLSDNSGYWYHVVTLTFELLQGQICCQAGDHNSLNLLVCLMS